LLALEKEVRADVRTNRSYLVVCVCLAVVSIIGCSGGMSKPLTISVVDGERARSYRGTEVVQYYRWWADLSVRNETQQPLHISLDGISYGREKDVVKAGVAEVGGTTYARTEWQEAGGADYGRPDERMTIAPGTTLEIKDVGFESHPESNKGTIRVAVEGMGTTESPPVDFMSFKSRPGN
jgi:hypothetical protein